LKTAAVSNEWLNKASNIFPGAGSEIAMEVCRRASSSYAAIRRRYIQSQGAIADGGYKRQPVDFDGFRLGSRQIRQFGVKLLDLRGLKIKETNQWTVV